MPELLRVAAIPGTEIAEKNAAVANDISAEYNIDISLEHKALLEADNE
ncbi:MAG: hypothetical protein NTV34_02765 [Proteobacteria bacterium]|nr:hypothetical protein [Pseudomonadota bacterium]